MRKSLFILSLHLFSVCFADEGMWQPRQLPELTDRLMELGLEISPESLSSLDKFPMNAVVSLGGCSASFVSPNGLIVTNHHCVYGSIQYNSSPENNLLTDGFLAKNTEDEIRAAPGTRVYVTQEVTDVTERTKEGLTERMLGIDRYQTIEQNRKAIIAECEASGIHRCAVSSFHQGLDYFLIKRLEIRDIRLVYVPATSIGKYGGDIDNWQWPRHTGDFGFYRAYVNRNGMPADYSENNVPYQSNNFLEVSRVGVEKGDFVMGVGYPGSTNRYRTVAEIENQFTWFYPKARQMREDIVSIIEENTAPGSQARLAYENTVASLNNYAKNYQSMVESYVRSDFIDRSHRFESDLSDWINSEDGRSNRYSGSVLQLKALIEENQQSRERSLVNSYMSYASLPTTAQRLYRLAIERQKPIQNAKPVIRKETYDDSGNPCNPSAVAMMRL